MWAHFYSSNTPFAEPSRLQPTKAKEFQFSVSVFITLPFQLISL